MNNLVWTSVSVGMEDCLLDWIISLRKLAMYKDEVLILNYGADQSVLEFIKKYNVNIVDIDLNKTHNKYKRDININLEKIKNSEYNLRKSFNKETLSENTTKNDLIVNYRYIDIIPILKDYKNYNTAHFDVDIWFQDNITPLFYDIENANGCLFSPAIFSKDLNITSTKLLLECGGEIDKNKLNNQIEKMIKGYGGYINGGFIAGKTENVLKKFNDFKNKIETFKWPNIRGSNQAFLNYSFDINNDKGDYYLYNTVPIKNKELELNFNSKLWELKKKGSRNIAKCIHTVGMKYNFYKFNNFKTFWRSMNE